MDGNKEVSSPSQAGGSGGRRPRRGEASSSSSRRQMRLFGNDFPTSEREAIVEEVDPPASPLTIRNHFQRFVQEYERGQHDHLVDEFRDELLDEHIGEFLQDPNRSLSMLDQMKYQSMRKALQKYNLNVLNPSTSTISKSAGDYWDGKSRCCYIGHPRNEARFRAWIDKKWPLETPLTPEQLNERNKAEWTLYRSLQAMKYLKQHEDRAIYHQPSQSIYLSPGMDLNKVDQVIERHDRDQLPRLVYTDRMHFKTSREKKSHQREAQFGGSGKSMEEETSSEEEE